MHQYACKHRISNLWIIKESNVRSTRKYSFVGTCCCFFLFFFLFICLICFASLKKYYKNIPITKEQPARKYPTSNEVEKGYVKDKKLHVKRMRSILKILGGDKSVIVVFVCQVDLNKLMLSYEWMTSGKNSERLIGFCINDKIFELATFIGSWTKKCLIYVCGQGTNVPFKFLLMVWNFDFIIFCHRCIIYGGNSDSRPLAFEKRLRLIC